MVISFIFMLIVQNAQASRLVLSKAALPRSAEKPSEFPSRRAATVNKSSLLMRQGARRSFLQDAAEEHSNRTVLQLHMESSAAAGAQGFSKTSMDAQEAGGAAELGVMNWSLPGAVQLESALGQHDSNATTWTVATDMARDALLPEAVALLPAAQFARIALKAVADDVARDVEPAFANPRHNAAIARLRFRTRLGLVLVMAVATYFATLIFSASVKYRMCHNTSPVSYYADQRFHDMSTEGHDLDSFLDAFNAPPKNVVMQVTGFLPACSSGRYNIAWRGQQYRVAFNFSLDLSPWIIHAGDVESACQLPANIPSNGALPALWNGVAVDDLRKLRTFLEDEGSGESNDLTVVRFEKNIAWPEWEELATNIKSRIRQNGFDGIVHIKKTEHEEVAIYKNRPWANFMHSHTAKVLCVLSFLGGIVYFPYMWFCSKRLVVNSHYCVNVSISNYWPLIADKIGARGFCQDERSA